MTSAGELLAATCTAHGVRIGHIPGGIPSITAQDVLSVAAKVWSPFESSMMMAKYCLDIGAHQQFRNDVRMLTVSHKPLMGWSGSDDLYKRLADVVCDEFCSGGRCDVCKGTRENMTAAGKIEACRRCDGTGLGWWSAHLVGKLMGVGRTAYKNQWAARVEWLRKELLRSEAAAEYRFAQEWRLNRAA